MLCVMQNHIVQAFANSGNAIKPISFIRDLKSKNDLGACQMLALELVLLNWWEENLMKVLGILLS